MKWSPCEAWSTQRRESRPYEQLWFRWGLSEVRLPSSIWPSRASDDRHEPAQAGDECLEPAGDPGGPGCGEGGDLLDDKGSGEAEREGFFGGVDDEPRDEDGDRVADE